MPRCRKTGKPIISESDDMKPEKNNLNQLQSKHRKLDELIKGEMSSTEPDHLKIQEWKRRKLRLKEDIENLNTTQQA